MWAQITYGLLLNVVAGVSGAGAAVFGKLAGTQGLDLPTQCAFWALLLVSNALMLILFTRSLRYNSSLACTAATTAANISGRHGPPGAAAFRRGHLPAVVGRRQLHPGRQRVHQPQHAAAGAAGAAASGRRGGGGQGGGGAGAARQHSPAHPPRLSRRLARAGGLAARAAAGSREGEQLGRQQEEEQQDEEQQEEKGRGQEAQPGQEREQASSQAHGVQQSEQAGGELRSYAVLLAYDGTDYSGWQLQAPPNSAAGRTASSHASSGGGGAGRRRQPRARPTIQLRLEQALVKLTGETREALKVQGAGRTDAGVHARGQVAQFFVRPRPGRPPLAPAQLRRALNSLLPPDVRALDAWGTSLNFNCRYALSKTYTYDLHLAAVADPFLHRTRHHPRRPEQLNLDAMADAARLFVGTHDFSAFANVSLDGARKNPVRAVTRFELAPIEGGARFTVEGSGFLYRQVRHMTGALLAVGSGQLGPDAISAALEAGPHARTGAQRHAYRGWTAAEAKGLCLHRVVYPPASVLPAARGAAEAGAGAAGGRLLAVTSSDED